MARILFGCWEETKNTIGADLEVHTPHTYCFVDNLDLLERQFKNQAFDLIVAELDLPVSICKSEWSGVVFFNKVVNEANCPPIIVISPLENTDPIYTNMQIEKAAGWIKSPYQTHKFIKAINQVLIPSEIQERGFLYRLTK